MRRIYAHFYISIILSLLKYNNDDKRRENFSRISVFNVISSERFYTTHAAWHAKSRKESLPIAVRYLGEALDIFWSGPVGKHFSCIINVATRNLFTNADVSSRKGGRVRYESDCRKLAWIEDFMTNPRTTNSLHMNALHKTFVWFMLSTNSSRLRDIDTV